MSARKAITLTILALAVAGLGAAGYKYRGAAASIVSAEEPPVPMTRVVKGALEMSVHATGSLRAVQTTVISAPAVGGSILRLVTMAETGAEVQKGDVVMEFDPTEQQYLLEQSRSELAEADQNIIKMNADREVQLAQQQVDLMAARFDVRRAELAALPDRDLVSASEYQKNQISLEEARRKLAQMEAGSKSQTETSRAMLAVATEKRNKSKMAADRAQMAIDSLVVKAQMDGIFVPGENRDAAGNMFFGGMSLPSYQAGDNVFPGRQMANIFDISHMEVRCSVNELDRINVAAGQSAEVLADSLPGIPYTAKVKAVSGTAQQSAGPLRTFAVTLQIDQSDARLRPGTTVHMVLAGTRVENVLNLPRQAIFEKNGKSVVYARAGDTFLPIEVKPTQRGESRIALEPVGGIVEGLEVALVNPDTLRQKKTTAAPTATTGGPK
jgi:multidrug efflux pump subunit AcrA (membrane-fusion protein)